MGTRNDLIFMLNILFVVPFMQIQLMLSEDISKALRYPKLDAQGCLYSPLFSSSYHKLL